MSKIFVTDNKDKPLLPTSEARARLLLKNNKATVVSIFPFTIKLKKEILKPAGEFKCGIDDGAKWIGIAIANNKKVVFAGNIKLRQDVSRKILSRSQYRRARRTRNLRHRKARFLNRGSKGWIPPTIKQKKDSVLRVIDFMKKRLNITECVVEQGQFDISSMSAGYKLTGKEYQLSQYKGSNFREKVLWRDKFECQKCKSKERLQVHHITFKSNGGTNIVSNGTTLCEKCHKSLHNKEWALKKKVKHFKYPTHLQQGKNYLFSELSKRISSTRICFGWMTSKNRKELGLEKDHYLDASAMIKTNKFNCTPYQIKPRRSKLNIKSATKKCTEKNGFRHFDIVKSHNRNHGIIVGSIRSLKKSAITLRTSFDDNFAVSYNKSKILERPKGLIFINLQVIQKL